jgi:hypothetical protein
MIHAVIRSGHDAFHFFGEVSPYNIQTLRQHVRETAKESGQVHLRVEIDPEDHKEFARCTGKWLPHMAGSGQLKLEVVKLT